MTTPIRSRNKFHIAGLIAGLCVWTGLSGVGSLSPMGGLLLGLLTYWMLSGTLIWAVCSGDTGGQGQAPSPGEASGLPGWLLVVIVLSLLVWIGLSGVGDMPGSAGFIFALLAMVGLTGLIIWSTHGAADSEGHRFAALPEPQPEPEGAEDRTATDPAAERPQAQLASPAESADHATESDLQRIKGIGPVMEDLLHENGVTRIAQIAAWGDAEIDAMAGNIGNLGGRIRSDDWVGQARKFIAQDAAAADSIGEN